MKAHSLQKRNTQSAPTLVATLQKWMHYFIKHPRINFDFNLQFIAVLHETSLTVELTSDLYHISRRR